MWDSPLDWYILMNTLVTYKEMEQVGESLIQKYIGTRHTPLHCVDIEGFITDYLNLPIKYINFAEKDKDKIGFVSDGHYRLRVAEHGEVIERIYPKGTIAIDRYLLSADLSGQRRFTLAHEAAHVIFERMSPTAPGPCFNRYFDSERTYSLHQLQNHLNLIEVQTDRLASILLMPSFMVAQTLRKHNGGHSICIFGDGVLRSADKLTVQHMANEMGVSFSAMLTRLHVLKYTDRRDISEYIETEMNFGGNI